MRCFNQKIVGRAFKHLQLDESQLCNQIGFFYCNQFAGFFKIICFFQSGNTGRLRQHGNIPVLPAGIQFIHQDRIGSQAEAKPHARYRKYFRESFQDDQLRMTGYLVNEAVLVFILYKIHETFIYQ